LSISGSTGIRSLILLFVSTFSLLKGSAVKDFLFHSETFWFWPVHQKEEKRVCQRLWLQRHKKETRLTFLYPRIKRRGKVILCKKIISCSSFNFIWKSLLYWRDRLSFCVRDTLLFDCFSNGCREGSRWWWRFDECDTRKTWSSFSFFHFLLRSNGLKLETSRVFCWGSQTQSPSLDALLSLYRYCLSFMKHLHSFSFFCGEWVWLHFNLMKREREREREKERDPVKKWGERKMIKDSQELGPQYDLMGFYYKMNWRIKKKKRMSDYEGGGRKGEHNEEWK
jgi:hypothetical protein